MFPKPDDIEAMHKRVVGSEDEDAEEFFREEVRQALEGSDHWPVGVPAAAHLSLTNPLLKKVEAELHEAGYDTWIGITGILLIAPKGKIEWLHSY